jgi:hypothetical protein
MRRGFPRDAPHRLPAAPLLATLALGANDCAQGAVDPRGTAVRGALDWLPQQTTLSQSIDAQGMMLGCEQSLNCVLRFAVKDVDDKDQRRPEADGAGIRRVQFQQRTAILRSPHR